MVSRMEFIKKNLQKFDTAQRVKRNRDGEEHFVITG